MPQFPLAWDYKDGRTRVISPEGFGFIDKKSRVVIPPKYREVRDFSEGLARVQKVRR